MKLHAVAPGGPPEGHCEKAKIVEKGSESELTLERASAKAAMTTPMVIIPTARI